MCVVSRHRNLPPSDSLRVPPCLCFPGHTLQPLAVGARPDTVAFPLSLGRPPHVTPVCAVWGTGRPGQCRLVTPLPPVFHSTNPELRGRFRGLGLKSRAGDTAGGGGGGRRTMFPGRRQPAARTEVAAPPRWPERRSLPGPRASGSLGTAAPGQGPGRSSDGGRRSQDRRPHAPSEGLSQLPRPQEQNTACPRSPRRGFPTVTLTLRLTLHSPQVAWHLSLQPTPLSPW